MNLRRFLDDFLDGWRQAHHKGRYLASVVALKLDLNLPFLSFRTGDGSRLCFHNEGLPWGLWRGTYDDEGSIRFCLDVLRAGDTAVDIGTNIGHFTVAMASRVGPQGRVISAEPNPKVFACLEDNVKANGLQNVSCHCVAVGNREGSAEFHIPRGSSGEAGLGKKGKFQSYRTVVVPLLTFRALMARAGAEHTPIALVKIDVEGFEREVLEGMASCLPDVRFIIFEYELANFTQRGEDGLELIKFLRSNGFEVFRIDSGAKTIEKFDETTTSADLVAAHSLPELAQYTGYHPIAVAEGE